MQFPQQSTLRCIGILKHHQRTNLGRTCLRLQCQQWRQHHVDVAIIGCGVAGAYAAWRLRHQGLSVEIYESSDRIGGRMYTKKSPGLTNTNIELGAMRYDSGQHQLLHNLIEEVGLTVMPFGGCFPAEDYLFYLRGQHLRASDLEKGRVPYNLSAEEKGMSPLQLKGHYIDKSVGLSNVSKEGLKNSSITMKDGKLLHETGWWNLVKKYGTEEGYRYIRDTSIFRLSDVNLNAMTALMWGCDQPSQPTSRLSDDVAKVFSQGEGISYVLDLKTIREGFQALPEMLAKQFQDSGPSHNVRMGHNLRTLLPQGDGSSQLLFEVQEGEWKRDVLVSADKVVLALPKNAFNGLNWIPLKEDSWLKENMNSICDLRAGKMYLVYDRPWWKDTRYPGRRVSTDLPLNYMLEAGVDVDEAGRTHAVLLASYMDSGCMEYWTSLQDSEPIQGNLSTEYKLTRTMLEAVHNQMGEIFQINPKNIPTPEAGAIHMWRDQAVNVWRPGYNWNEVSRRMLKPIDDQDVFIVGSSFAPLDFNEWAEGALQTVELMLAGYFQDSIGHINYNPLIVAGL